MKKLIILFVLILFLGSVSAIRITEVEMNPAGGSSESEWIELYNDETSEKDISGWEIWEGIYGSSGPKIITIIPNGTIIPNNEFYIIEWGGAKLNNGGDFVILYDSSGNKIDETKTQKESSSSTKTWQLCEIWEFKKSTKEEKNDCERIDENTPEEPKEPNEAEEIEEEEEIMEDEEKQEPEVIYNKETEKKENIQLNTIKLNAKTIKTEDNKENPDKNNYPIYGFVVFCILLGFLFILKKKKNYKTEFEGHEE